MTLKTHEGEPVLVEIRCKAPKCGRLLSRVISAPRCNTLLDRVMSAPESDDESRWSSWVHVHICPRHGEGGGHGDVRAWQERQRRAGKPTDRVRTGRYVCWSELRPAVEKARHTGRTQKHYIV